MRFKDLKRELTDRPMSQLPALAFHIAELCGRDPVFKSRDAFLDCMGRHYDIGSGAPVRRDPAKPTGKP